MNKPILVFSVRQKLTLDQHTALTKRLQDLTPDEYAVLVLDDGLKFNGIIPSAEDL